MYGSNKYLVINAGSSSLKFSLYNMPEEDELINGYVEKIGNEDSFVTIKMDGNKEKKEVFMKNHESAVKLMLKELIDNGVIADINEISGIGHRVLHGGEFYKESVIIDDEVLKNIESLTKLGPLHHPGEIAGIRAMQKLLPNVPEIAVFDTAFHQTMPKENYMYPVPMEWYVKHGVRKYGFHGTSHKYITEQMKKKLGNENPNLIICHIGSGASISCIRDGICVNTTMGLTPLDGLMMGTRSGAIDPSILEYVTRETSLGVDEVTTMLNKKSGLLGIAGKNDLRDVEELSNNGDENAKLAIEMMKKSIVDNIAKYYFELDGNVDAICLTAGVGENAINLRHDIVNKISKPLGIKLDESKNKSIAGFKEKHEGEITTTDSCIKVFVSPTDEEIMILRDTYALANKKTLFIVPNSKVFTKGTRV